MPMVLVSNIIKVIIAHKVTGVSLQMKIDKIQHTSNFLAGMSIKKRILEKMYLCTPVVHKQTYCQVYLNSTTLHMLSVTLLVLDHMLHIVNTANIQSLGHFHLQHPFPFYHWPGDVKFMIHFSSVLDSYNFW